MAKPISQSDTRWVPPKKNAAGKVIRRGYVEQISTGKKVTGKVAIVKEGSTTNVGGIADYRRGRNVTGKTMMGKGKAPKGTPSTRTKSGPTTTASANITGNNPPPPPRGGRTGRSSSAANKMTPAQKRAYEAAQRNRPVGRTGQSSSAANNMNSTQAGRYSASRPMAAERGAVGRGGKGSADSPGSQIAILKRRLGAMQMGAMRLRAKSAMTVAEKRALADQQKQIANLQQAIRKLGG